MKIRLIRTIRGKTYTAGSLYLNEGNKDKFICNTLEDQWRDLMGVLGKKEKKVYGETCIPEGEYEIRISPSPKYTEKIKKNPRHALAFTEGYMPRIMNVPFFEGILLHTGNHAGYESFYQKVKFEEGKQILTTDEYVSVI